MERLRDVHEQLESLAAATSVAVSPILDKVAPRGSLYRVYAGITSIGVLFWLIELLLLILLKPLLVKIYKQPLSTKADAKTQLRRAKGAAIQTVSRLVGSIHNSIQVPLSLLLIMDTQFRNDRVHTSSYLSYAVVYISAGYFFHDLVMCLIRYSLEGPLYTIHALSCHTAYTFGAATGFLHYFAAAFLLWEISTPFVHARWIMYKAGLANTSIYVLNGLAMIVAFFGCRIVWGYIISYFLVNDVVGERLRPDSPFPVAATVGYCFVTVVTNSLNTFWFYKMVRAAVAMLIVGKKGTEVGSHKDE